MFPRGRYNAVMARFTATEMVGVPLSSVEVQRLLAAIDAGHLGDPQAPENVLLRQKLTVLLQVAAAREKQGR